LKRKKHCFNLGLKTVLVHIEFYATAAEQCGIIIRFYEAGAGNVCLYGMCTCTVEAMRAVDDDPGWAMWLPWIAASEHDIEHQPEDVIDEVGLGDGTPPLHRELCMHSWTGGSAALAADGTGSHNSTDQVNSFRSLYESCYRCLSCTIHWVGDL
jgi:hypothetical protein